MILFDIDADDTPGPRSEEPEALAHAARDLEYVLPIAERCREVVARERAVELLARAELLPLR